MQTNKCLKCKHEWLQRDLKIKPKVCPKCKSYDWNNKIKIKEKKE